MTGVRKLITHDIPIYPLDLSFNPPVQVDVDWERAFSMGVISGEQLSILKCKDENGLFKNTVLQCLFDIFGSKDNSMINSALTVLYRYIKHPEFSNAIRELSNFYHDEITPLGNSLDQLAAIASYQASRCMAILFLYESSLLNFPEIVEMGTIIEQTFMPFFVEFIA